MIDLCTYNSRDLLRIFEYISTEALAKLLNTKMLLLLEGNQI